MQIKMRNLRHVSDTFSPMGNAFEKTLLKVLSSEMDPAESRLIP